MNSLRDHFLLAMPCLEDTYFSNTLTYICEHNESGALGLVINRSLDLTLADIFRHLDMDCLREGCESIPILCGGPVQEDRGFVLHPSGDRWECTLPVSEGVSLTTSQDILTAMAGNGGPEDTLVALGYAGWGAGQLEEELAANAWLSAPADTDILFHTPMEKRLHTAATRLGIDYRLISPEIGHG